MGWWKVQGTDHLIGDAPLDALGAAFSQVVASYRKAFDRLPTAAEWEQLLEAVMAADEGELRCFADVVDRARKQYRPVAVTIRTAVPRP